MSRFLWWYSWGMDTTQKNSTHYRAIRGTYTDDYREVKRFRTLAEAQAFMPADGADSSWGQVHEVTETAWLNGSGRMVRSQVGERRMPAYAEQRQEAGR